MFVILFKLYLVVATAFGLIVAWTSYAEGDSRSSATFMGLAAFFGWIPAVLVDIAVVTLRKVRLIYRKRTYNKRPQRFVMDDTIFYVHNEKGYPVIVAEVEERCSSYLTCEGAIDYGCSGHMYDVYVPSKERRANICDYELHQLPKDTDLFQIYET